jgi:hypothetical protein
VTTRRALTLAFTAGIIVVLGFLAFFARAAIAHDDGHFAAQDPKLHAWFDQLASGKGLCCSFADGVSIEDVDWDTNGPKDDKGNATYRVRLNKQWINVPPDAVVTEPNKFGPAVVWPYQDYQGVTQIRCFLPGAGA